MNPWRRPARALLFTTALVVAAGQGVPPRSRLLLRLAKYSDGVSRLFGQAGNLRRVVNPPTDLCKTAVQRRLPTGAQDAILPHNVTLLCETDTVTIGAALVPPERVRKIFSFDVDKNYAVVEVAIYPQDGRSVDVDTNDFVLKVGSDDTIYPAAPHQIGSVWKEKNPPPPGGVRVETTSEVGVIVAGGKDPVTGRNQSRTGVYTAVRLPLATPKPKCGSMPCLKVSPAKRWPAIFFSRHLRSGAKPVPSN